MVAGMIRAGALRRSGMVALCLALGAAACDDTDSVTSVDSASKDRVSLGTVAIGTTAGDLPAPTAAPDAQMQAVLTEIARANLRPIYTLTPSQARDQPTAADAVRAVLATQGRPASAALPPVARVEHRRIAGPAGADSMLVRVYTPAGT